MKRVILSVLVAVMMMITAVGMTSVTVEAAGKKTTTTYSSSKGSSCPAAGQTASSPHWINAQNDRP